VLILNYLFEKSVYSGLVESIIGFKEGCERKEARYIENPLFFLK